MYKFFIFFVRFFPYLPVSRSSLLRTLSNELYSGKTIVEAFSHMSESMFSRRLRLVSRIIYEKLKLGSDFAVALAFFPALFSTDFLSIISQTNKANVSLRAIVDVYLEIRIIKARLIRAILVGNFSMILLAIGAFLVVDWGAKEQLVPIYNYLVKVKIYKMPLQLQAFVLTYKFFLYVVLPYVGILLFFSVFFVFF